jgi:hypothetical protein
MTSCTHIPYSKIPNPEGQTSENITPRDLDNIGNNNVSIPCAISNEEVNAFICIAQAYVKQIGALLVAPLLPH